MLRVTEDPTESFDPGKLRASNADREAVAQTLQTAMAEGRLTLRWLVYMPGFDFR